MSGSKPTIHQVCAQLSKYYESLDADYDALFSTYCDDNGFDTDMVLEELEAPAEDCELLDFDEDFPFSGELQGKKEEIKREFMYNLIKKCYENNDLSFEVAMPPFDQEFFDVTEQELEDTKKLYRKQCPTLWNSGMEEDQTFLRLVAIGQRHKLDYLQHVVDDYFRGRVDNVEKSYPVEDWSRDHKHFKGLEKLNKIPNANHTPYELVKGAVKAFGARCCPKLLFSNIIEIDDSLEVNCKYIVSVIKWIGDIIKSPEKKTVCPFQIDLCLGYGAPAKREEFMNVEDDDDDDDDDENDANKEKQDELSGDFFDCIGGIKKKLIKNNLKYQYKPYDPTQEKRFFGEMFKDFKNQQKEAKEKQFGYPHNKRFVTFIDRRMDKVKTNDDEKKEDDNNLDDIWMYEAPKNCRDIPNGAVPEWYISASKTCLLPNMEYGDGKKAEEAGKRPHPNKDAENKENKEEKDNKQETKEKLQKSNIGASSHCKGSLLTLSFIVKEKDAIKIYMYWNGQIAKFCPEDIKSIFPKVFNMKWNNGQKLTRKKPVRYQKAKKAKDKQGPNAKDDECDDKGYKLDEKGKKIAIIEYESSVNELYLAKEEEIDKLIEEMKNVLNDKHFASFVQSYK